MTLLYAMKRSEETGEHFRPTKRSVCTFFVRKGRMYTSQKPPEYEWVTCLSERFLVGDWVMVDGKKEAK